MMGIPADAIARTVGRGEGVRRSDTPSPPRHPSLSEIDRKARRMQGRRKALLVVNPGSGNGRADLGGVVGLLTAGGFEVSSHRPEEPEDVPTIIGRMAENVDIVVIGGGDGTFNRAAPALLRARRPLGILPLGTANDLARTLSIPTALDEAAEIIAAGNRRRIDVGLVNGHPFFNVASIGFGAEVARFHRGERKRRLGVLSYPLSWLDAYKRHRPFEARIACDGTEISTRCVQLAVGNGRHYGGGLTISEDAEISDGWLRVWYVRPVGPLGLLRLFPAFRFGTLGRQRHAHLVRGHVIDIATKPSKRISVDGELVGRTPASFRILSGAMEVFAPNPQASTSR